MTILREWVGDARAGASRQLCLLVHLQQCGPAEIASVCPWTPLLCKRTSQRREDRGAAGQKFLPGITAYVFCGLVHSGQLEGEG